MNNYTKLVKSSKLKAQSAKIKALILS